ncbi:hypothetical protein K435DRAFT_852445 [Dendrothele bispora CBS 962.96]|uniref:Uncharacterized protein n=1 Tax=Dendrothele bispora (strain CBS 962.96) TaxID=1314807 RepID=A0A4S8MJ50_DENBC|nr:hypothetical protein K435DRAFT_852445 [Dendrothele bispora CBS 962.96]
MANLVPPTPFISHPWFKQPSMKRKQSSSPEDSDDSRNVDLSKPVDHRPKRPKLSTIERGFSSLSIDRARQQSIASSSLNVGGSAPSPIPIDDAMDIEPTSTSSIPPPSMIPSYTSSSSSLPLDPVEIPFSTSQVPLQPSSIEEFEEPDSPPTRDRKMKGTSWYEPEPDREHHPHRPPAPIPSPSTSTLDHVQYRSNPRRPPTGIVVTDLDSSDEEDTDEPPVTVSPALLERLRQRELLNHPPLSIPLVSTALVLYRPLNIPPPNAPSDDVDDSSGSMNVQTPLVTEETPAARADDNVAPMDTEPMDLDG